MSHVNPSTHATQYRVVTDDTDSDAGPHLLEDTAGDDRALCGTRVTDPEVIEGTTTADSLPSITDAMNGSICVGCVRRAHEAN